MLRLAGVASYTIILRQFSYSYRQCLKKGLIPLQPSFLETQLASSDTDGPATILDRPIAAQALLKNKEMTYHAS